MFYSECCVSCRKLLLFLCSQNILLSFVVEKKEADPKKDVIVSLHCNHMGKRENVLFLDVTVFSCKICYQNSAAEKQESNRKKGT